MSARKRSLTVRLISCKHVFVGCSEVNCWINPLIALVDALDVFPDIELDFDFDDDDDDDCVEMVISS